MLQISCPYCGPRDETEFRFGSEKRSDRPANPETVSDAQWGDYIFNRTNSKGTVLEEWVHFAGCGRWFLLHRNTATHQIADTEFLMQDRGSQVLR